MCGLCGIACFDANRSAGRELLPCVTSSMARRGPDFGGANKAMGGA